MPSIPQTSVIFAYLVLGWFLYITAKGELGSYLAVIFGPSTPSTGSTTAAQ